MSREWKFNLRLVFLIVVIVIFAIVPVQGWKVWSGEGFLNGGSEYSSSSVRLTGVVRDEAGKTVESADVRILPMGTHGETKTDAEGKFEVNWNPRMWGSSDMEVIYYLVVRHHQRNLATAVEIQEDTKTLDVNLPGGVVFAGKVIDAENKPIAGSKIIVMLRASRWDSPITEWRRGGVVTDSEGKFEVKAIPTGHKYSVIASAEGYGKHRIRVFTDDAVDNRLDVGEFTLLVANLSVSGIVVDVNEKPVAGARISAYGENQPAHRRIMTDAEGKFVIEKVCAGRINISAHLRSRGQIYGFVETEGGATDVQIVVSERRQSGRRSVPKQPSSLAGKGLPDFNDVGVKLKAGQTDGKMLLVCFFDIEQRPSRHFIKELIKQQKELKEKGVFIVAVQASKIERGELDEWVKKNKIGLPVGMVEGDEEKARFIWGFKALPWMILTDKERVVYSNGFSLDELSLKIKEITER